MKTILLILAMGLIASGVFVTIGFLAVMNNRYAIGSNFDPIVTGIVGDFVGGIAGSIWALAGVVLFYLALKLQTEELAATIKAQNDTNATLAKELRADVLAAELNALSSQLVYNAEVSKLTQGGQNYVKTKCDPIVKEMDRVIASMKQIP